MRISVSSADAGKRLDVYLSEFFDGHDKPDFSRSRIKTLISDGCVKMPKRAKVFTSQVLKEGDVITVRFPQEVDSGYTPENIPLNIYFEDEHLLVLYKPRGMVVHPAPGHGQGTLVNALLYHCGDSLLGISGVKQPGIVHRLDQFTEGLMLAAKTEEAHKALCSMLAEHQVTRKYCALVWGKLKEESGTVNAPIGRSFTNRQKMAVHKKGKEAITHYKLLKQLKHMVMVECVLETGRTHQIRVHMKHIGFSLVGDALYGNAPKTIPLALKEYLSNNAQGQFLVSYQIAFTHPITKESIAFETPIPKNFQDLIDFTSQS